MRSIRGIAFVVAGLAVLAVPCLAAFGVLRTIVDRLTIRGALIAEELLLMVKPQETARTAAPAMPRPAGATPISPQQAGSGLSQQRPGVVVPSPAPATSPLGPQV